MPRSVIGAAMILTAVTLSIALAFVAIIVAIAQLTGFTGIWIYVGWALILIGLPAVYVFVRRKVFPDIFAKLKANTKKDWERLGIALTLVFTVIAAFASLQSIYGKTVTEAHCYDAKNIQVNFTSTDCQVIQTVSLPQQGPLGPWGVLFLDLILVALLTFGAWTAVAYLIEKAVT